MSAPMKPLADDASRHEAITVHDRSFLVEAGAGSGKTAVLAGRIALMLAEGVSPASIAAVTFTEFAASELLVRVREFVNELTAGRVPTELRVALGDGLSDQLRHNLAAGSDTLDEMTCSTIHGFCQRLIKPYPVEADIDPGATVIDRNQSDLAFAEITDRWLREELAGESGSLLAEIVFREPDEALGLVNGILRHLRSRRILTVDAPATLVPLVIAFGKAAEDFSAFVRNAVAEEQETVAIAIHFAEMAEGIDFALTGDTPADLVRLLIARPHSDLCTASGSFRVFKKKGKWADAAKRIGFSKADGDRLNVAAEACFAACCNAWTTLSQAVAARILADLVSVVQPVMNRFRDYKRSTALLDFDDLIFAARDLLRDHESVRRALAARFTYVLVDEFQDTDPLQTEIFWRLCGDPQTEADATDWTAYQIRPGALFLVGDPKQAIYRFRGADVAAYIQAREYFLAQSPDSVLSISTNFRSCAPILQYVEERFKTVLSVSNGQPGYTPLDPFHPGREEGLCVAALNIAVADEDGKASAEQQRDGEAEAVADMCAHLIGSEMIFDRKIGERRPCRPGDIALLAPTGSDLWRYEEAMERRGIPVATQAGKGLFRRQEIQDLIAITRVLADPRDTLALGALLRGPLVGLTEEELLDIVWALPRREDALDAIPRFDLGVDPEHIVHPYARGIIEKLKALRRQVNATTPHDLLSQSVDVLRMRPIILQRHNEQAERALANVDLYLSLSQSYGVRGLRAFSEMMTAAWTDESRAVEGRPDAQEESVALYTMHASKGLEWPIVVPVNTMTQIVALDNAVVDRTNGRFYCPVLGVRPTGYEAVRDAEKAELDRERIRLWYVAATRACELLILPRMDVAAKGSAWLSLLDLSIPGLPSLDLAHLPAEFGTSATSAQNRQTREIFVDEAARIVSRQRHIRWLAPSRDEAMTRDVLEIETPALLFTDSANEPIEESLPVNVQGGRERGLLLHKLIEEVLTGETEETEKALCERAATLILALGCSIKDQALGLSPTELANSVLRTLALPEVAALRPGLMPEFPVYSAAMNLDQEEVIVGFADAIAFDPSGVPQVVVDWKSDVAPSTETIEHYRSQVRTYLDTTGGERGLIVLMTPGTVIPVTRTQIQALR